MRNPDKWANFKESGRSRHSLDLQIDAYEIFVRDGKEIMRCPWGQELPASSEALDFWDRLQEIERHLTPQGVLEFCAEMGVDPASESAADILTFCDFLRARAEAHRRRRAEERVHEED
jgi:hypothetical protein